MLHWTCLLLPAQGCPCGRASCLGREPEQQQLLWGARVLSDPGALLNYKGQEKAFQLPVSLLRAFFGVIPASFIV